MEVNAVRAINTLQNLDVESAVRAELWAPTADRKTAYADLPPLTETCARGSCFVVGPASVVRIPHGV
jgi:hypothetical protein